MRYILPAAGILIIVVVGALRSAEIDGVRAIPIPAREHGYQYLRSEIIDSRDDFETLLGEIEAQEHWNPERAEALQALRDAKIDFDNEFLVLIRNTQGSGSNEVSFEVLGSKGESVICAVEKILPWAGTDDMAYYCFAIAVARDRAKEVRVLNRRVHLAEFRMPSFQSVPLRVLETTHKETLSLKQGGNRTGYFDARVAAWELGDDDPAFLILERGMRVDLVVELSRRDTDSPEMLKRRTVAGDVTVLGVGAVERDDRDGAIREYRRVGFRVSEAQGEKISRALKLGNISIVPRLPEEEAPRPNREITLVELLKEQAARNKR